MTDFPAVVYLKAELPLIENEGDTSEKDDTDFENDRKRFRSDGVPIRTQKRLQSYKRLLEALNHVMVKKLNKIEESLDLLSENCDILEEKVDSLTTFCSSTSQSSSIISPRSIEIPDIYTPAIPLASTGTSNILPANFTPAVPLSSKIMYITLNSEADFPKGSWLGFENNPEMRVRCKISPKELNKINKKCPTPEKMALTLLDYLFDRETQACSNISGMGKHKKKQLDPLFIYAIRCHLMFRFDINEEDWTKIKVNMDSKCRTAFRRKKRGMPLTQKVSI